MMFVIGQGFINPLAQFDWIFEAGSVPISADGRELEHDEIVIICNRCIFGFLHDFQNVNSLLA